MIKYKLTPDEIKQISHFITQRSIMGDSSISAGEVNKATDQYLETYNQIRNKIEEYNIKD